MRKQHPGGLATRAGQSAQEYATLPVRWQETEGTVGTLIGELETS
jgi:hypothetical protein